jgi:Small-conductance mechanosensitive channel
MQMLENFDYSSLVPLLLDVAGAIVLLIITFVVAGWAKRATRRSMERSELDTTLRRFFSSLARYAVLILGGLAVLGVFGISVASFAAVLAAAGFAVGMALQGTLAHFASGIMLLIFRPFTAGDKVSAAGVTGTVVEIGLFTTLFDTVDNRRLIVPNGAIYGSTIENITHHDTRRVDIGVGTEYDADLGAVRSVLEQTAASIDGGLSDPAPQVYLSELGGSSINWSVRVWAKTSDYWEVKERLTHAVKQALDEHGIGMPYPQMDVHLDNVGPTTDGEKEATTHDAGPASSA